MTPESVPIVDEDYQIVESFEKEINGFEFFKMTL